MRFSGATAGGRLGGGIGACAVPAALLLAVVMGHRSSLGLFLSPINTSSGLGLAALSLALAASQLAAGLSQPLWGLLAERHGAARIIAAGAVLFASASAAAALVGGGASLALLLVAAGAAGSAVGAPLLLGIVGQRVAADRRGLAAGLVTAGGSAGQMAIAHSRKVRSRPSAGRPRCCCWPCCRCLPHRSHARSERRPLRRKLPPGGPPHPPATRCATRVSG